MTAYSIFARYYDLLTSDVDYDAQAEFLHSAWVRYGLEPHIVIDLGCGTGSLLSKLTGKGYDLIGVDASEQMLSFASQKLGGPENASLICQRLEKLDLFGTVDSAVCFLDGLNHVTPPGTLQEVFRRVSLFLNPGGIFLFDLNSPWQFEHTLRDNAFVYDYDELYCVWQSRYRPRSRLCRFDLTFFERREDVFARADETFCERSYSSDEIGGMLETAGLTLLDTFDGYSFRPAKRDSARLVFTARKMVKENERTGQKIGPRA